MIDAFTPGANPEAFLRRAMAPGYSMEPNLVLPEIGQRIADELGSAGLLEDLVEMNPVSMLRGGLPTMRLLHRKLNDALVSIEGKGDDEDEDANHLPMFSVRVFEPGEPATTIHRNDSCIRPWAIGVTLFGESPFSVYEQDKLEYGYVRSLRGDGSDPTPSETMEAGAGAAWCLYTANEQRPHSGGLVRSTSARALLIFYNIS
jgi:hypothetical protein